MNALKFLRNRSGVSSIEFAILSPVFIGLIFAIADAGFLIFTQLGLEHAVESAARCAVTSASTCGSIASIQKYAVSQAYGINIPTTAFSFTQNVCGNLVTANYTYTYFSNNYMAASIPLSAQACFPN